MHQSGQLMEENIQLTISMHHSGFRLQRWRWVAAYPIPPEQWRRVLRAIPRAWTPSRGRSLLSCLANKVAQWIGQEVNSCFTLTVKIQKGLKLCHQSANNYFWNIINLSCWLYRIQLQYYTISYSNCSPLYPIHQLFSMSFASITRNWLTLELLSFLYLCFCVIHSLFLRICLLSMIWTKKYKLTTTIEAFSGPISQHRCFGKTLAYFNIVNGPIWSMLLVFSYNVMF